MNKHINEFVFGEVDISQNFIAEDLFGSVSIKGRYKNVKISVYGGEGPIPHFHLRSKEQKNGKTLPEICICLFVPCYFDHGDYKNTGTFENNSQAKIIDDYLRNTPFFDKNKNIKYDSVWKAMVDKWFESNPGMYNGIEYGDIQPDYRHISGYKQNPSNQPVKLK